MSAERLKAFQDAATVYENGRRGDVAATTGIGFSLLLLYPVIRFNPPYPAAEVVLGAAGALIFWRLRRGDVTPMKMRQIAFVAAGMAVALAGIWIYRFGKIPLSDWWFVGLMETAPFVGVGIYAWWSGRQLADAPQAGRDEYEAVRAEVERAESQRPVDADAVTRSFLKGSKLWFVRPVDLFASVMRFGLNREKVVFEKVAVVPGTAQAIKAKLIEMDGADAVQAVEEKLGRPKV
jgi:hypothetical protein